MPDFEKETGVSVKYVEDVNSNEEFFAKMQPLLANGESGGRSLFVVTDWMAKKMHELGYLQEFEPAAIPNFEKNLVDNLRGASYDPGRDFAAPWQSGMTGIIVNKELAPDIHSICDLFEPQVQGQDRHAERTSRHRAAGDEVRRRRRRKGDRSRLAESDRKNQGRRRIGPDPPLHRQRLLADLTNGNVVAAIGWSGDAVQLQADNPNIEWRMPTEGCILWSDNMVIPVGAPNPTAAEAWINYVYDP